MIISVEKWLYILLSLFGFIYGAYIFGMYGVVSFLFFFSFVVLLLLYIESAKQFLDYLDYLCMCVIGIALICVLLNAINGGVSVNVVYLKKWMCYASTIIFFNLTRKIQPPFARVYSFLKYMCFILSFLTVYQYVSAGARNYVLNDVQTLSLMMNFENPNKFGLFLTPIFFMLVICFVKESSIIMKIVSIIMASVMYFFILESRARTSALTLVFFILIFSYLFFYKKQNLSIPISFLFATFPLLYAFFYLQVVNTPFFNSFFAFAVKEGKPLNSRCGVWNGIIDKYSESPIIGAYNEITDGTGMSQSLNTHIDVLASYGLLSFVLFVIMMTKILRSVDLKSIDQKMYLSAFIAVLFCGLGEAALYSGGTGLNILVGAFLILAYSSQKSFSLSVR